MFESLWSEAQNALYNFQHGFTGNALHEIRPDKISIAGPRGCGKRTLYNNVMGWRGITLEGAEESPVHDLGLFSIVTLSTDIYAMDNIVYQLEDSSLVVYMLDGAVGLRQEDLQWIARLRSRQAPLVIVLNKIDCINRVDLVQQELEAQLSLPVLPIRANKPEDVQSIFIPGLLKACPEVIVPLAAQVIGLRQQAAMRVIRQAAMVSLITSLEPVPLIDLSVLTGVQIYMVNRLFALYNVGSGAQARWEIGATVAVGLLIRYIAETLAKFVPYGGWVVSGLIGASGTWLVGMAALTHLEAQATHLPLSDHLRAQVRYALQRRSSH
ncbi:MAG: DUF697 domain-containing protein [Chloroflexota bacterium]